MTLQVDIREENKEQIINAIKLLKGVKKVKEQKCVVMTKADLKAYKKAKKELENGEAISHEELKKRLGI